MATGRAPKQWSLTKTETITSFEAWKNNLVYTLSLDSNFSRYLLDTAVWNKKSKTDATRGLTNYTINDTTVTAAQQVTHLELMLGQIANFCPIISRNTITRNCKSLNEIWQAIRQHYGFQSTGSHFVDLADIKLEAEERPEDLYQRIVAFVEDSLLCAGGNITHHGEEITEDEDLTPTLENFIVLTWLRLVHPSLPRLVKQRFGTELRSRTLASIKPEISMALDSLLDEINSGQDAIRSMRTSSNFQRFSSNKQFSNNKQFSSNNQFKNNQSRGNGRLTNKSCPLCKQAGRPNSDHFLSTCKFLPDNDRNFLTRARLLTVEDNPSQDDPIPEEFEEEPNPPTSARLVQVKPSPYIYAYSNHHALRITIDTGCEANMIKEVTAHGIGAKILPSTQQACQADGHSEIIVTGETEFNLTRGNKNFYFKGLVVKNIDVDILGGIPFMDINDITVRPAKHQIILEDGTTYSYKGSRTKNMIQAKTTVLRVSSRPTTVWPDSYIEVPLPEEFPPDSTIAIEPRETTCNPAWPEPTIIQSVGNTIRLPNLTKNPMVFKANTHMCQVSLTFRPDKHQNVSPDIPLIKTQQSSPSARHSASVQLDPDNILSKSDREVFNDLLLEYDDVFNNDFQGYNHSYGYFEGVVNMGPVKPPQRKGRCPQYSRNKLMELQDKIDSLEKQGVFKKPEEIGVVAEYLNPSFLINKPSGGSRLVTAFNEVGKYCKPQPSLMPDMDSTIRTIGKWKYLIVADLTSAFYQIPLSKESMKYCGIASPYKGIRVYTRLAMGMPGSETALEELLCRVLGDLIQEEVVTKNADDLFIGGNTPLELLDNFRKVLIALDKAQLKLSAPKTIISPKTALILGWIWTQGTLKATKHKIAALNTCEKPTTVKGLRSFIGAYKILSRVIPRCSDKVAPLDKMIAGLKSNDRLTWTDQTSEAFKLAQIHINSSNKAIVLPKPDDKLWIVVDGASKDSGIGATLYVMRNKKLLLAGFFSQQVKQPQIRWFPCEIEGVSIAAAVKHYAGYIIQSLHAANVLTDNKPCVQAYGKLCKGEFSASARLSTFLSTAARFHVNIQHLSGSVNLPTDFSSRNPVTCDEGECQVCKFANSIDDTVVRHISITDITEGKTRLPFTSRNAWFDAQTECKDLRRTKAHLLQGTRPSKKQTNIKDVKRYLTNLSVAKDGLLVVKKTDPLTPTREVIVIPRDMLQGLLTALHLKLYHPSEHQLKTLVKRYFYALDFDKAIEETSHSCHTCASLKKIPHTLVPQSSSDPPNAVGLQFAADIIKSQKQLILVTREYLSSYTMAMLINSENLQDIRQALISLLINFIPLDGPSTVVRTDPAPAFQSLAKDQALSKFRIMVDIGRIKNPNKNPVAEKAIQELQNEILKTEPSRGPVTHMQLQIAVANLNSRIRNHGLSSREILFQRDQFTNEQIPINDQNLIKRQMDQSAQNHPHSERSKAHNKAAQHNENLKIGDLVYLYIDGNKCQARDRYIVSAVENEWIYIKKFTGSQLRSSSYKVKRSECYQVPVPQLQEKTTREVESDTEDIHDQKKDQLSTDTSIFIPPQITQPLEPVPHPVHSPSQITEDSTPNDSLSSTMHQSDDDESYQERIHNSQETCLPYSNVAPRRSTRNRRPPTYLGDYSS